ncbi:unnamed protein product, partial [Meganyctiphanes norvegica]
DPNNKFYQAGSELLKNFSNIFTEVQSEDCEDGNDEDCITVKPAEEQQSLTNGEKYNLDFIEWKLIIRNEQSFVIEHETNLNKTQYVENNSSGIKIIGEIVNLENIKEQETDLSLLKEESSESLNENSKKGNLIRDPLVNVEDIPIDNSDQLHSVEAPSNDNALNENREMVLQNNMPTSYNTKLPSLSELKCELREYFDSKSLFVRDQKNPCYTTQYLIYLAIINSKQGKLK